MSVYAVLRWTDNRNGGNEVKIIGVYLNEEKARNIMTEMATNFAQEHGQDIEEFENGYNVTDGTDYTVFELSKTTLQE